ncbi:MAG TPA: thioredoxin family protein [Pirellulales bacterium]
MRSWLPSAVAPSLFFAAMFWVASFAAAGEFNTVLSIGDAAPAWKDLPGVDEKNHSLADLKTPIVVVAFTCNTCEYSKDYEDRLIALTQKYSGEGSKVSVVAINVNPGKYEHLSAMEVRAGEKNFNFPYLYDASQQIARDYGAVWTPEFFVLNAERKIVYMGALDDNTDPDQVNNQWVDKAIIATLDGGAPETKETAARGCAIKFNAERKRERKPAKE